MHLEVWQKKAFFPSQISFLRRERGLLSLNPLLCYTCTQADFLPAWHGLTVALALKVLDIQGVVCKMLLQSGGSRNSTEYA